MSFSFKKCTIDGLYEIEPCIHEDTRGSFFESWSMRDFASAGINAHFVQDNQSKSVKGVLRGLHFQRTHSQGKLVRVLEGSVFDVAVDIRQNSKTFGQWYAVTLSAKKNNMFYIPEGFAHGYFVLTDTSIYSYKCTDFYYPEDEGGLIWNDSLIGIEWPDIDITPILSDKDSRYSGLNELTQ